MADGVYLTDQLPPRFLSPYWKQVALGIVAMTIAGLLHPLGGIAVFLLLIAITRTSLRESFRKASTGLLLLFTGVYLLYTSVLVLVLFTFYFQTLYYWSAKKPVNYYWISAVGFVHLAIVSTVTGSVLFPLVFVAYVVVLTESLLVSNFLSGLVKEEGDLDLSQLKRVGPHFIGKMKGVGYWIAGISILIAVAFFPFLPRFQKLSYQPTQMTQSSVTGFTDEIMLGEMGEIRSDNRVALRIFASKEITMRTRRWRGATLEDWNHDNQTWTTKTNRVTIGNKARSKWAHLYNGASDDDIHPNSIRVNVASMPSPAIFLPETEEGPPRIAAGVKGVFETFHFDEWSWTCQVPSDYAFRSFDYEVGLLPRERMNEEIDETGRVPFALAPVLALPPKNNPYNGDYRDRCLDTVSLSRELAEELRRRSEEILRESGGPTVDTAVIARRLSFGVQTGQDYTLDYTQEQSAKDLEEFVFERKAGHCEYFATSLALMLRINRIPSRIVTGFRPGRSNFFNSYQIVRQADAHSWVEAYLPGKGWSAFDPTPSAPPKTNLLAQNLGFLFDIYDFAQLQWNSRVIDYSTDDQRDFLTTVSANLNYLVLPVLTTGFSLLSLRKVLAGVMFLTFLVWLIREVSPELSSIWSGISIKIPRWGWFGRRRRVRHLGTKGLLQIEKEWGRRGLRRPVSETPKRYIGRIAESAPQTEGACDKFIGLYSRSRFGREPDTGPLGRELRSAIVELVRSARKKPQPPTPSR